MTTIKTPADLKEAVNNRGTETHFFSRNNMRFAGDTMRNFRLTTVRIQTWYDAEGNHTGSRDGVVIQVYKLYRKNPVKKGNTGCFYFDMEKFTQRHGHEVPDPAYSVGQLLEWTNDYGVYLGIRKVTEIEYRTGRPCYYITPTDTPWFAVGEEDFKAVNIDKPSSKYATYGREFKTHAFPDDASANAFMQAYRGWGLIGIDIDEGIERLRHVAHINDKGVQIKK